jgi:hypothetical protein
MSALLAALVPRRRTGLVLAGVGAVIVAGGVLAFALTRGDAAAQPCRDVTGALDAQWPGDQREALAQRFVEIDRHQRDRSAGRVLQLLDDRADRWRAARIDVCEAARVRTSQTPELTAKRLDCLDRSLVTFETVLAHLRRVATPADLVYGITLVRMKPDPDECTAERADRRAPALASRELVARVAAFVAASLRGQVSEVLAQAPAITAEVEQLGDLELIKEVRWAIAEVSGWTDTRTQRDALRRAAEAATAVGDHALAAAAWSRAAENASEVGEDRAVDDLLAMARAAAALSKDPEAMQRVDVSTSSVALDRGDLDAAIAGCGAVLRTSAERALLGAKGRAYDCLEDALMRAERWTELDELVLTWEPSMVEAWGDQHPYVLIMRGHRAHALFHLDQRDAARAIWRDTDAGLRAAYGDDSLAVMNLWSDIAIAESEGGAVATEEAKAASTRAIEIGKRALPAGDVQLARLWWIHATMLDGTDDDGARVAYEQALTVYDKLDDREQWARLAVTAAALDQRTGRCTTAEPRLARVIAAAAAGEVSPLVGSVARVSQGACVGARDVDAGLALIAQAAAELVAAGEVQMAADAELTAAELAFAHGRKAEARALAKTARARVTTDSGTDATLRARADKLLQ